MTGLNDRLGNNNGGLDLRSTLESTTMDVHGIVHLTREVWCCLRRRGNAMRKEVATLTSPLSALKSTAVHRSSSPTSRTSLPVQPELVPLSQQQRQTCRSPLPVAMCSRVQPEASPSPISERRFRLSPVTTQMVCDTWSSEGPSAGAPSLVIGQPLSNSQDVVLPDDVNESVFPVANKELLAETPSYAVHTTPSRIRAAFNKGLLERRGSNASLTLNLSSSASASPIVGSPPKESLAEEFLTTASRRMNREKLSLFLLNPTAIYEEFWKIPMNHPDKIEVPGSGVKNRYRTIIPNEATRVRLVESSKNLSTTPPYINANYIRGYGGEQRAFIATQGPMSNTVTDFWAMVWQERCPVIVMITKLTEHNRTKCECYMPESTAVYGAVHVTVDSQLELDGLIVRHVTLQGAGAPILRTVHYWYTTWPDQRAPQSAANQLLVLIRQVELLRFDQSTGRARGPVVVHCSAGIGRTGCFIATSIALQQLRVERLVDILGIVCALRIDRGGMIQTNEQYEFVHRAVDMFGGDETQSSPHYGGGSTWNSANDNVSTGDVLPT